MTKARTAPVDLGQQLAEANATIAVLRRSVHEEHAGAARAYLKLEAERARLERAQAVLRAVLAGITYAVDGGENCRFCDANMDHEGTYRDMHSKTCVAHAIRAALPKEAMSIARGKDDDRH